MRKVKIETLADVRALPEDEWVFVPEGMKVEWGDEDFVVEEHRLEVTLPKEVSRKLRALKGKKLKASIRGRRLTVQR